MKEQWDRVREVFDRALDLPARDRSEWLARECGADQALLREVSEMLAGHDRAEGILDPTEPTQLERPARPVLREIGHYSVLREIGRGGMGVVYQARDLRLDRFVALKFLSPDLGRSAEGKARLLGEARAASALDHPGICTVFDIGESEEGLYLAMAYYEGESLAARLQDGPISLEAALRIACRTAEALAHAHDAGIVHRDVKPSNIFLTTRGEVKILDFGVAKLAKADYQTQPGMLLGTPAYMSPEQLLGDVVDHRTDIWSLGVVLFESVTGKNPFLDDRKTSAFTAALFQNPPSLGSLVPEAPDLLGKILARALAKRPEDRYSSIKELLGDLERARSLCGPGQAARSPASRLTGGELPIPLSSFIGRQAEVDRIRALLPMVRVLTLTGTPGTGKTRLAIEVARQVSESYQNQVYFVPLASVMDSELVPFTIAQTLGIRTTSGKSITDLLRDSLRQGRCLLVLDNFEQVVAAGSFLADLLTGCPQLQALITSRMPLHITGEHEFPVSPLTLPDPASVGDVTEARRYPSVALFEERARAATGSFELNQDNLRQVADLCVRLDGLPLAIELAASRAKLFSPETLLARLASRMGLLKSSFRDRPARHQTLRQAIAWSYDLLEPELKAFFRRASLFRGGFSIEAAAAVVNSVSDLRMEPFDAVFALLDHSLLRQKQSGGSESRLFMLETIREFGLEMLRESGEMPRAQQAHSGYYLDLARQAEPALTGPRQVEWLDLLEQEHDNIRLVLAWSKENRHVAIGLRLSSALWRFWLVRGYLVEGYEHLRHFLGESAKPQAAGWLRTVWTAAGESRDPDEEDQETSPEFGEHRAAALLGAGNLAHNLGDIQAARAWLEESLSLYRATADQRGTAAALNSLGWVGCEVSEFDQARALSQEALRLTRDMGDKRGSALALNNLGWVANYQGDYDSATAFHSESLALRKEIGDERGVAFALSNLGWAEQYHGDYSKAESLLREAIEVLSRLNDRGLLAWALIFFGRIAADQGDSEAALVRLERSVALWEEVGNRSGAAYALAQLGSIAGEAGDFDRSQRRLGEAMEIFHSIGCGWGCAYTRLYLARLNHARGDLSRALRLCREAIEALRKLGDGRGVAEGLETLAALEASSGGGCSAAASLATALALRESLRIPRPPAYQTGYQQTADQLKWALGEKHFSRCWEEGTAAAPSLLDAPTR
jgi:predicted ATPase/Tfp pilus assembly protein PilF